MCWKKEETSQNRFLFVRSGFEFWYCGRKQRVSNWVLFPFPLLCITEIQISEQSSRLAKGKRGTEKGSRELGFETFFFFEQGDGPEGPSCINSVGGSTSYRGTQKKKKVQSSPQI
jgi:hypothetical protein